MVASRRAAHGAGRPLPVPRVAGPIKAWFSSAMNDRPKAKRGKSREDRLRAALRENLRRRKAQARRRGPAGAATDASPERGGGEKPAPEDES